MSPESMTRIFNPHRVRVRSLLCAISLVQLVLLFHAASGRADDKDGPDVIREPELTDSDRGHWAFQTLRASMPPAVSADVAWSINPIDQFILARLEAAKLKPMPRADRLTYLRRVKFDLHGLPPTPDEQARFLSDRSPEAHERLVDQLLASPHYGERWAQHWLDLARFAETDGFEHDLVRPNAWRYRDWVIDALNADVPYDEFVRLQIAGDLLKPGDPTAAVATGWLLCGPDMPDINLQEERRHSVLNEMTSTVGAVFLGLQIGCAQCHDHKFDPLNQADFYRLRACFESADIFRDHPIPTRSEQLEFNARERERGEAAREIEPHLSALLELAKQRLRDKNPDLQPSPRDLQEALTPDERARYKELERRRDKLPKLPDLPLGRVLREGPRKTCRLAIRGDFRRLGPELLADWPRVLSTPNTESLIDARQRNPRVRLAEWLTRPDNPLPARVIVNRIWQYHFGEGLVRTPSDFGKMGEEPTHPELLDWLAIEFPRQGWSLKWVHKLLVTSATYRQASRPDANDWSRSTRELARTVWEINRTSDRENRLLSRMPRLRLEGEAIRDAMRTAAGDLNPRAGGPGIRPPLPQKMVATLLKNQWPVTPDVTEHQRRSIYLFVRRNLRYPLFEAFDRPDSNASCPRRNRSTIAPQALILFNSDVSLEAARRLCGLLLQHHPIDRAAWVTSCYQRCLGRPPNEDELSSALEFLDDQSSHIQTEGRETKDLAVPDEIPTGVSVADAAALTDFCLAVFNLNEFIYID